MKFVQERLARGGAWLLEPKQERIVGEDAEETRFSFSQDVPQPPERRQQVRHLTILRVGALVVDGTRELCLIRNISAGGLMVHVYMDLRPDQRVAVELKTHQQLAGTVVWVRGTNVGIAFDRPIDIAEMLHNPPLLENGWRPRLPRVDVDRLATVRIGATVHWATIRDISQGGVKIETERTLEPRRDAVITPEGFRPVQGVVRWASNGTAGVAFNQTLPFGELMTWLKSQPST